MQYDSRKRIKIGFVDYYDPIDKVFTDILLERFDIIRDDKNPDYLFFCDETFGQENTKFDSNPNVKKIFFTGENRRPSNYNADFYVSFDHEQNKAHYRLPLYVIENFVQTKYLGICDIRDKVFLSKEDALKREFCSFVASNGSCLERNTAFFRLNKYKRINSGGPLFNNIGKILPRDGGQAQKSKLAFLRGHKFNLCYENSSYPGYVTEKLFHALCANTVPIYWGSCTVGLDFNERAFVNRLDFSSDEDMIRYIQHLDQTENEYMDMLEQDPLSVNNVCIDTDRFLDWFTEIVYVG